MLVTFNDDPDLFENVVTGDESRMYGYYIEPKPNHRNGKHFATIEEIKEKSKQGLLCFENWKKILA